MDRRSLLKLVGAGALAATATPLLAACGKGASDAGVSNANKSLVDWPAYVPFAGPAADGAPDATGVQSLFLKYPQQLVQAYQDKPGDGSKVTAMVITYGTPPKGPAENQFWGAVNKALGVDLNLIMVPDADFQKKMATMMASGDLPDLIMFGGGYQLPDEQAFIAAQCQDLSELVGGDSVKAFPSIANIPPYAWKGMGRIGGKIYGIPIERPMPGTQLLVNRTALDGLGAPREWDADQFLTAMKGLGGDKKWGLGGSAQSFSGMGAVAYHAMSFGAPNGWKVEGGKFVSTVETDQFRQALELMRKLNEAKVYYPDTLTVSQTDLKTLFYGGTVASFTDGYGAMLAAADAVNDRFAVDFALPYGKTATHWQGTGRFGYVTFKKASADRIKMLMRLLDFLAAPFGTKEYELVNFGVEGVHFNRGADGGIVKTDLAKVENPTNVPIKYIAAAPVALYYPARGNVAQRVYDWEKAALGKSIADPSNGLRSATFTTKGAAMGKVLGEGIAAVVFGRRPISDWDAIVKDWKAAGGDASAAEFATEYAATGK